MLVEGDTGNYMDSLLWPIALSFAVPTDIIEINGVL